MYWQKKPANRWMSECLFSHYFEENFCSHECFGEHTVLSGRLIDAGEFTAFSFVFVQVFGDYYHFRHHAVEKRALTSHKGMHIRLQKEPQVRLLSALTQLTVALHIGNKRPKDRLDYTVTVCLSQEKKGCSHQWQLVKLCILQSTLVLPSVPLTRSKAPHSCKYAKWMLHTNTTDGRVYAVCLPTHFSSVCFKPVCAVTLAREDNWLPWYEHPKTRTFSKPWTQSSIEPN